MALTTLHQLRRSRHDLAAQRPLFREVPQAGQARDARTRILAVAIAVAVWGVHRPESRPRRAWMRQIRRSPAAAAAAMPVTVVSGANQGRTGFGTLKRVLGGQKIVSSSSAAAARGRRTRLKLDAHVGHPAPVRMPSPTRCQLPAAIGP